MGNQNVKPAKRPAQVYPFNDTDKKSRTDWTAGRSEADPSRVIAVSSRYLKYLDHFEFLSAYTKFLKNVFKP